METLFFVAAIVAVVATALAITRLNPVHALLYLIVSLLAVSVVFYTVGAPFLAALEVIIYAGAIMVLFIFVVMLINPGEQSAALGRRLMRPGAWVGPGMLSAVLLAEVIYLVVRGGAPLSGKMVTPKQVALALYQPYLIGVELASFLLMAGLIGAYHLGLRADKREEEQHAGDLDELRTGVGGDPVHAGADRPSRAT
jgi:NADH-quinone oxidoreductase subunit J